MEKALVTDVVGVMVTYWTIHMLFAVLSASYYKHPLCAKDIYSGKECNCGLYLYYNPNAFELQRCITFGSQPQK